MSEWQKVRVTFEDADGRGVSVAGWRWGADRSVFSRADDVPRTSVIIDWVKDEDVKVTPIRELPSGVGAVILVTASNDRFNIYDDSRDIFVSDVSGKWWNNSDGDTFASTAMDGWQYEVLSEGIKL